MFAAAQEEVVQAQTDLENVMKESPMPVLAALNVTPFKNIGCADRKLMEPGCGATAGAPGKSDARLMSDCAIFFRFDTRSGRNGQRQRGLLGYGDRHRANYGLRGSARTRRAATRERLTAGALWRE